MEKKKLIAGLLEKIENDLQVLKAAAKAAYTEATHEESKPENQYDTRALEASYLADAQAKRVEELESALALFRSLPVKDFGSDEPIAVTALVALKLDGKKTKLLLMPKGGGLSLEQDKEAVQIVTPASSLGQILLGLKPGDTAEFQVGPKIRICEILSVE